MVPATWNELLTPPRGDVDRGLPSGTPGLLLQAPKPRMGVGTERGLSRLEREGVAVSLTLAGRDWVLVQEKEGRSPEAFSFPHPYPRTSPGGPGLEVKFLPLLLQFL